MREESQSVKTTPGFFPHLVLQPVFEGSIRAQKERGGSAAGIDADGPLTGMSPILPRAWLFADAFSRPSAHDMGKRGRRQCYPLFCRQMDPKSY